MEGLPVTRPESMAIAIELRTFNALTSQALRAIHALDSASFGVVDLTF
jgi:hypothetical protein